MKKISVIPSRDKKGVASSGQGIMRFVGTGRMDTCKRKKTDFSSTMTLKEEGDGWYASSATERKEHMESISLVGGQPSFYAENIPFSSSTIFSSSPTHKLVSCCVSPRLKTLSHSGAFRQDLYNHATSGSIAQCCNYVRADAKHNSRSGGCEFDHPNHPCFSLI